MPERWWKCEECKSVLAVSPSRESNDPAKCPECRLEMTPAFEGHDRLRVELDRLHLAMLGRGIAQAAMAQQHSDDGCRWSRSLVELYCLQDDVRRYRDELLDLAVALEASGVGATVKPDGSVIRHGGSGRVCPECAAMDDDEIASYNIVHGIRGDCPRCSVPAGEWVECDECRGTGDVVNLAAVDYDSPVNLCRQAVVPCPTCDGRGRHRAPVPLGVVYDEEFFEED